MTGGWETRAEAASDERDCDAATWRSNCIEVLRERTTSGVRRAMAKGTVSVVKDSSDRKWKVHREGRKGHGRSHFQSSDRRRSRQPLAADLARHEAQPWTPVIWPTVSPQSAVYGVHGRSSVLLLEVISTTQHPGFFPPLLHATRQLRSLDRKEALSYLSGMIVGPRAWHKVRLGRGP